MIQETSFRYGEAFFFSPEVRIIAYVPVPKDLTNIKSKLLFGSTRQQLVCFGSAALVGVPLFFLSKGSMGTTFAALCMVFVKNFRTGVLFSGFNINQLFDGVLVSDHSQLSSVAFVSKHTMSIRSGLYNRSASTVVDFLQ